MAADALAAGVRDGEGEGRATPDGDRLLTASEIAEMLNVPERWVREHTRSGLLPHVKLGRYRRYRRAAVLAWLADQEHGGAAWGSTGRGARIRHEPVPGSDTKWR